jgi:hypothetical protein
MEDHERQVRDLIGDERSDPATLTDGPETDTIRIDLGLAAQRTHRRRAIVGQLMKRALSPFRTLVHR